MRPRVIPVLLLDGRSMVKTRRYKKPVYIGDPLNAVKIFNEKRVDELLLIDINVTKRGGEIDYSFVEDIASEAFMPMAYGGGVRRLSDVKRLLSLGLEKVVVNEQALEQPTLLRMIADEYGSQSLVVSIDVGYRRRHGVRVLRRGGSQVTDWDPPAWARRVESLGAGEILLTNCDREGTGFGFDAVLVREVSSSVSIPVIAHGGAASVADYRSVVEAGASAVAAGSMFVFHGSKQAVLISYPAEADIEQSLGGH